MKPEEYRKLPKEAQKFFHYSQIHTGKDYKCEYNWNSNHKDLQPTLNFEVGGDHICYYCGRACYPIQSGLKREFYFARDERNYDITGYCCICEDAFKELQLKKDLEKLYQIYQEDKEKLFERYNLKKNMHMKLKAEYQESIAHFDKKEPVDVSDLYPEDEESN